MSWNRMLLVLIVVAGLSIVAAGCGDDDEDNGDGATEISVPTEITVPTDAEGAEEAKEQATSIATEAKSQAYEACVDSAEGLPEPQKGQALKGCDALK